MRFLNVVLAGVALALAAAPAQATEIIRWEVHGGDPQGPIPDENYKYLDANQACVGDGTPIPPVPCQANPRNVRNFGGPQVAGGCVYDVTCTCGSCGVNPDYPNGGNTMVMPLNAFTSARAFEMCVPFDAETKLCPPPRLKVRGVCKDCDLQVGNPVNIYGSRNKYQRETIYSAASGGLQLVLSYNSESGSTYFLRGPFGRGWSSDYFARVRDSGQGIIMVERPDGVHLQFMAPSSGAQYQANADINDRVERVNDGSGNPIAWRLTAEAGDRVEEHGWTHAQLRGNYGSLLSIRDRALVQQTMTYSTAATPASIAPLPGLLIAVTDGFGRQLNFTYDSQSRVVTMTDPGGGTYSFEYDGPSGPAGANNLTKITFPDGRTRVYFYREAAQINGGAVCTDPSPEASLLFPNALTGRQDENGARHATYTYDCEARVTSSQNAGGSGLATFTSNVAGYAEYVDPLGTTYQVDIQTILAMPHPLSIMKPAASGTGMATKSATYDAQGNPQSRTDYNGNRTSYTYDLARNLETSRTEGLTSSGGTTPQTRTITTQWHATFRLPTGIAEPLRITTFTYDADGTACGARGALCSKSIQATTDANGSQGFSATPSGSPRTWTYTYNANGSVLTVNGPRTDITDATAYTYYANNDASLGKRGNVATITNAAGHVTSINAYNAHGQPLTIVDPNGLTTTLTYDLRQRLKTRTGGSETTTYDYDYAGQLTKVTLPDGSFLAYDYDDAHRLVEIQDNLGNKITYTLDAKGNRTAEQVRDPASALVQTRSRVINSLNQLFRELGAASQTTEYTYDDQGNVLTVKDPLNRITANQYDALNRLKQVTSPTPVSAVTQYAYDGIDQLVSVTDPLSLVTGYTVNGLGNLIQQSSPDTGTTASTYDTAGNLLTQTDAKSQVTTYAYDALNRVTLITFHDGSKQEYGYDSGTNGIGRLTSIVERNPSNAIVAQTAYGYDQHGRLVSEARTINGVVYTTGYRYDAPGRMDRVTYPSGRTVDYGFDATGRIASIATTPSGGSGYGIASGVAYHPFGGVKSFNLANGETYTRTYDQDGRTATYTLGGSGYTLGYDAASRIEFITQTANPPNTNTYGYDALDRLTSATLPAAVYGLAYDAVGNRLTRSTGGNTDTYA